MCDIVPSNIIVAGVAGGVDCGRTRVGLSVGDSLTVLNIFLKGYKLAGGIRGFNGC